MPFPMPDHLQSFHSNGENGSFIASDKISDKKYGAFGLQTPSPDPDLAVERIIFFSVKTNNFVLNFNRPETNPINDHFIRHCQNNLIQILAFHKTGFNTVGSNTPFSAVSLLLRLLHIYLLSFCFHRFLQNAYPISQQRNVFFPICCNKIISDCRFRSFSK